MREILFPKICPLCREELCTPGDELCASCRNELPELPERTCPGCGGPNDGILTLCPECIAAEGGRPWEHAVTAYPFHGTLRTAIHEFKYRGRRQLLPFLATSLHDAWQRRGGHRCVDAVTYIPLHPLRYLTRGYNQSELLARELASRLGVPCKGMLWRMRHTPPQARLNMERRLANLTGAFKLRDIRRFSGSHILLVDDVFTTGSTLTQAARLLLKGGAAQVYAATVARD